MRRRVGQIGEVAILACLAAGCGREVRPDYPQVPLLISKKPVELQPENAVAALTLEEPPLPAPPASALAWTPPDFEKYVRLVNRTKPPKSDDEENDNDKQELKLPPQSPSIPALEKSDISIPLQLPVSPPRSPQ